MNAVSPICLTDLVPALRWSDPAAVGPVLRHARLIEGWWNSLPLTRVLDIAGATWLAHSLARLAAEQWGHLELGEFLPTLRAEDVDLDDIAEPVRGALLATAGSWERLVSATPAAVAAWGLPESCGPIDVISTATWRAVNPFAREQGRMPAPSPALMVEAVRTLANWLPASAPEHVHSALAYLTSATGADADEADTAAEPPPPQSPATRAIRTLRALRAQRDEEARAAAEADAAAASEPAAPAAGAARALRRPAFGPPKGARGPAERELGRHPLVDLLEELLRTWTEVERTVAAERLFATDPISIRLLADQINVDLRDIRNAQRTVEERLLQWLSSPGGAPLTKHMRELSEQLGAATTVDHVISAHPDHPVEVPSLGAPLWRVVITLFTDRRLHNGWLVADDPHRMRWQTRELLGDAPSLTDATLRLGRIGIRQQAVRAWLLSTPGVSIRDGHVLVDPTIPVEAPPPGSGGSYGSHSDPVPEAGGTTTANGLPIRRRPGTEAPRPEHEDRPAPPEPPRVAASARCFRAPDGRWWHRVDVTADHLNGAPVTVPPGYATHLGLQPGRLLCLTAPGADLLVLVWRDQPAFDSLRPLLRRLSVQPGDRVFITVNGDRLDARRLPAADMSGHSPTGRALHLIGYTAPAPTDEALKILARRISEDGDDSQAGDPHALLEALTRRGDTDIAQELRPVLMTTS
ncbi:hypothetical protein ACFPZ0_08825 [Streptomonospora nanhaiensis]|uniref:hypothetical protein n=1 Tax=Streptomonospora nanhaiensis TaxID=1323731 RepID=UPI001C38E574|nr:hypothetical protein [Streptomonospora nanhaiensis]MBV2364734.1 hypothetical protein [Streptomonospora nanhaiensis]MBX9389347.1 hypothetical protein [Streptomonospora nanhaiensis]